jgi:hypothetical protein
MQAIFLDAFTTPVILNVCIYMRTIGAALQNNPYMFMLSSTVLVTVLYYLYSRTLPLSQQEINKSTAKVAAVSFLSNMALAYLASMGQAEPLSSEPFVMAPPVPAP